MLEGETGLKNKRDNEIDNNILESKECLHNLRIDPEKIDVEVKNREEVQNQPQELTDKESYSILLSDFMLLKSCCNQG